MMVFSFFFFPPLFFHLAFFCFFFFFFFRARDNTNTESAPKVTLLTPPGGPEEGGTEVVITGENFYTDISLVTVLWGETKLAAGECTMTIPHTELVNCPPFSFPPSAPSFPQVYNI
jgi:hypothetical protein